MQGKKDKNGQNLAPIWIELLDRVKGMRATAFGGLSRSCNELAPVGANANHRVAEVSEI